MNNINNNTFDPRVSSDRRSFDVRSFAFGCASPEVISAGTSVSRTCAGRDVADRGLFHRRDRVASEEQRAKASACTRGAEQRRAALRMTTHLSRGELAGDDADDREEEPAREAARHV